MWLRNQVFLQSEFFGPSFSVRRSAKVRAERAKPVSRAELVLPRSFAAFRFSNFLFRIRASLFTFVSRYFWSQDKIDNSDVCISYSHFDQKWPKDDSEKFLTSFAY